MENTVAIDMVIFRGKESNLHYILDKVNKELKNMNIKYEDIRTHNQYRDQ